MIEVTRKIAVQHDYSWLDKDGNWSEPEKRYNNPRELPDFDLVAIKSYKNLYQERLGKTTEYVFGRLFEGIYGYRWTDRAIVIIKTTTTTEETIV